VTLPADWRHEERFHFRKEQNLGFSEFSEQLSKLLPTTGIAGRQLRSLQSQLASTAAAQTPDLPRPGSP